MILGNRLLHRHWSRRWRQQFTYGSHVIMQFLVWHPGACCTCAKHPRFDELHATQFRTKRSKRHVKISCLPRSSSLTWRNKGHGSAQATPACIPPCLTRCCLSCECMCTKSPDFVCNWLTFWAPQVRSRCSCRMLWFIWCKSLFTKRRGAAVPLPAILPQASIGSTRASKAGWQVCAHAEYTWIDARPYQRVRCPCWC